MTPIYGVTTSSICNETLQNSRFAWPRMALLSTLRRQPSFIVKRKVGDHIGGEDAPCKPWGTEIIALGSPLTFVEPVASIAAAMNQRARKAFGKHSKLLSAPTPLKARIKMHTTLVRNAALWASQSWPITETLHKPVNSTQLRQLRTMLGDRRSPGETWVDWNCRMLRRARVALFQSGEPRWSTFLLGQT